MQVLKDAIKRVSEAGAGDEAVINEAMQTLVKAGLASQETIDAVIKLDVDKNALLTEFADWLRPLVVKAIDDAAANPGKLHIGEEWLTAELREQVNVILRRYPDYADLAPVPDEVAKVYNLLGPLLGLLGFANVVKTIVIEAGGAKARALADTGLKDPLHAHRCACGNEWSHTRESIFAGVKPEEKQKAYEAAHKCSACGAEARDKVWVQNAEGERVDIK